MPGGPYAEKLRQAIDTGRTGDKICHPDPAAAPLGTDEEAAGTPLRGDMVDQALRNEIREPDPGPESFARDRAITVATAVVTLLLFAILVWLML